MQIGDLVTWKVDVACGDLDYGVVIGIARKVDRTIDLLWVKFLNGHKPNVLPPHLLYVF